MTETESMKSLTRSPWRNYLLWCANEHIDFRHPEIESILSMFHIPHRWIEKPAEEPWVVISLPDEEYSRKIMSRSISVRFCVELWTRSKTVEDLHKQTRILPTSLTDEYYSAEKSFKFSVETFNKVILTTEKLDKIESFSYLPLEGPVKLKDPDVTFYYLEYFGLDPGRTPDLPLDCFFGRWICESQRSQIYQYRLSKRKFIGNTSMDPQLAMIMANMAQVRPGDLVLDPFVGTGSLLVAAAHFGGFVTGTEIDYSIAHGISKPTRANQTKREANETIRANMKQYGLLNRYLDILVSDASRFVWNPTFSFDAFITDPPYGIRESTERVASKGNTVPKEYIEEHFPSKSRYDLKDIYRDLLNSAARYLKVGGRAVFWVPIIRADYSEDLLPKHSCFRLIANSEQILTTHSSRRLLTMEKFKEPEDNEESSEAVVCDLQSEFREKYFQAVSEETRLKLKEMSLRGIVPKRSKRGQGIQKIIDKCEMTDDVSNKG